MSYTVVQIITIKLTIHVKIDSIKTQIRYVLRIKVLKNTRYIWIYIQIYKLITIKKLKNYFLYNEFH